ncbi:MAG: hypothetical protein ACKV2U_28540 [Bryobacteraceae bacterium]
MHQLPGERDPAGDGANDNEVYCFQAGKGLMRPGSETDAPMVERMPGKEICPPRVAAAGIGDG